MSERKITVMLSVDNDGKQTEFLSNDPACINAVAAALGCVASTETGAIAPDDQRDTELENAILPAVAKSLIDHNQCLRDKLNREAAEFEAWRIEHGEGVALEQIRSRVQRIIAARTDLISSLRNAALMGVTIAYKKAIELLVEGKVS